MPQTTLTESATCTTCVLHVARISNVESVLFGIREDLEDNSLEKCLVGFACNRDINLLFYFDLICFQLVREHFTVKEIPEEHQDPVYHSPDIHLLRLTKKDVKLWQQKKWHIPFLLVRLQLWCGMLLVMGGIHWKRSCAACVWERSSSVDFGLDFDFIGEQGVVISTLRVILAH